MRRTGTKLDVAKYDPAVHDLPNNRATRKALEAFRRTTARRLARNLARFVGKPLTPALLDEMIEVTRGVLGGSRTDAERALRAGGFIK